VQPGRSRRPGFLVRCQRARAVCAMAGITTAATVTCITMSPVAAEVAVDEMQGLAIGQLYADRQAS